MKKILVILSAAAMAFAVCSCSSAEKMAKQAENVIVKCNPSPYALKGGLIPVDITVTYPKDYFNAKAILEVTPVIVYADGEAALDPIMYQGEKVKNNYKTVPTKGGVVKEALCFPYKDGMQNSYMELRGRCSTNNGNVWVDLPTKKVADGCYITETLAGSQGYYDYKDHNYQAIINLAPEGQVMYTINSSKVRKSELNSESVNDFQIALKEARSNSRKQIKNIEVVAYASPDGPEAKNNQLSADRSKTAKKAFDKVTKDRDLQDIETTVKSIGEDWEGFQQLVAQSDIEDKDLILRVLNMYNDPKVREKEIRNIASVFQEVAEDVLPQLRRARFIANVEFVNYTDAELQKILRENSDILDEPALLKAATLCYESEDKVAIYEEAIERFNSDRARYNLVCVALDENNNDKAAKLLEDCDDTDPDVINLEGVIAMRQGRWVTAKEKFQAAKTAAAQKNLGVCAILSGNYTEAVTACGDKGTDAALANLLNGNPAKAMTCLDGVESPTADYIRAICYKRLGESLESQVALKKACDADPKLAKRAETDIEFAK